MRLTDREISALRSALRDEPVERVFLFGSRTDDSRRGGDIDILVYSSAPPFPLAHRVASRYARAADARLDVLVVDPANPTEEQRAFLATIHAEPLDVRIG